jgi:hypothetical protein
VHVTKRDRDRALLFSHERDCIAPVRNLKPTVAGGLING